MSFDIIQHTLSPAFHTSFEFSNAGSLGKMVVERERECVCVCVCVCVSAVVLRECARVCVCLL